MCDSSNRISYRLYHEHSYAAPTANTTDIMHALMGQVKWLAKETLVLIRTMDIHAYFKKGSPGFRSFSQVPPPKADPPTLGWTPSSQA